VKNVPEVGKTYDCFDDGKICESRRYKTTIITVVSFSDADKETLYLWVNDVENHRWLYATETDYFVFSISDNDMPEVFVRAIGGGWFSMGEFLLCGRLDIDGTLTRTLIKSRGYNI